MSSSRATEKLGDVIIVDDDDERLVLKSGEGFRAEVVPDDAEGEWRNLVNADEIVEFYDPTDVFGDLADALAEAFPSVAPEIAGASDKVADEDADAEAEDDEADDDEADDDEVSDDVAEPRSGTPTAREHAPGHGGARRQSRDPAAAVAPVLPRPDARQRGPRRPVHPHPARVTSRG